ncbi:Serine protease, partial [Phytophthora palmivora]
MWAISGLFAVGLLGRCSAALQDAQGLEFADAAAFCAFHCSPALLSQPSQCSSTLCGRRRALETAENGQIDVLSCNTVEQNASTLAFSLTLSSADSAQVFQGFHDAFFQAYDAMLGGDSVTADACQLAFLQDKLLPSVQDDDSEQE